MASLRGTQRSEAVEAELRAALAARGPEYSPRTRHMDGASPVFVNRLIGEASPYLLQHAHNPVDWWPWGEEAQAEAARRDVPLFISAGYATCHWCHVMEEGCFEDEEVAAALNAGFVPVKIDRETDPEADQVYILATSLQNGHAGWPNSVWALPDGRPFHTGTYFPKPYFLQLLGAISAGWAKTEGRAEMTGFAGRMSETLSRVMEAARPPAALDGIAAKAEAALAEGFNAAEGGFSRGQQFPQEGQLLFLLDHWRHTGSARALHMAETTIDAIVRGGLQDHAGGGFHRYTVDVNWRTPHFEKMLYNQALMLRVLAEGVSATGREDFRRAAKRLVVYLLRDLTDEAGTFFSGEDADSLLNGEREEGAFYVWSREDAAALISDEGSLALGLGEAPTLETGGVVHIAREDPRMDGWLETLREAREVRPRPLRDDKVLLGWNGLMIRGLVEAGIILGEPDWIGAGERAARALFQRLGQGDGFARYWSEGRAHGNASLADIAAFGLALQALADAGQPGWEGEAARLTALLSRFEEGGRYRLDPRNAPLGPVFEIEDGATPSGESLALELLAKRARRGDADCGRRAAEVLHRLSGQLAQMPVARLQAVAAHLVQIDGESGACRALAEGKVRARLEPERIVLDIAPGWHVTGPDGEAGPTLGGAEGTLPRGAEWSGQVVIPLVRMQAEIALTLQACSGEVCLAPQIEVWRRACV